MCERLKNERRCGSTLLRLLQNPFRFNFPKLDTLHNFRFQLDTTQLSFSTRYTTFERENKILQVEI